MKFYLLSPNGVPMNPHLFPMFIDTWKEQGIEIADRIENCDVLLIDLHTRISDYNESDFNWVKSNSKPIVTFCEWDRGKMSSDIWPFPLTKQQEYIFKYCVPIINFCRLLNKEKPIEGVYPYEKPILYEEPIPTQDELFNRDWDICFIANTSPSREAIKDKLIEYGKLKYIIRLGGKKMPFDEFVRKHKLAKLFITSGAGGYTDERKQHLFSVAGIIQEETDQLLLHPFTHLGNCLKISSPPTTEELNTIHGIVNDKERLYAIYKSGYDFMKIFYSKQYIANDILGKIKQHLP